MQSDRIGMRKEDNDATGTNVHVQNDNILSNASSLVPLGCLEESVADLELQGSHPDHSSFPNDERQSQSGVSTDRATARQDGSQDGKSMKGQSDHPFDNMDGVNLPDYVKTHDTHLTFPEKLMLMLMHIEQDFAYKRKPLKEAPIAWSMQGKAFVIRDREEFIRLWLPLFFRSAKFSSFTRKLYRWGFRQISSPRGFDSSTDRELYFFNSNFQKNHKSLMTNMSSVTAETKRQQQRRESTSNAEVAIPLALAHYPFAESKEQNIGDTVLSSQLAYQQSGMVQSALDFQMNMGSTFGFGQSLNNALASQLTTAGPSALLGLHQQNTPYGIPNSNPMPMFPQSLQQVVSPSVGQTNMNNFQSTAPSEASRQWTYQQLQLLGFLPQHQQTQTSAQALSRDSNPAFNMAVGGMAASGGWSVDGRLSEPNQHQQQLANTLQLNQQLASSQHISNNQQLAELVLRFGASNVNSLHQNQSQCPPFPQPHAPSPG